MRFLTKIMKTPDDDREEGQDEFDAEEKGLLMAPTLPGEQVGPAAMPERDAPQAHAPTAGGGLTDPPQAGAVPAEDGGAQPLPSEGEPPGTAGGSPPVQGQAQQALGQEAEAAQGSSDSALDLFRTGAARGSILPPVLKEGLEEVSVAALLAEARSIRDGLLGGRAAGGADERKQKAA